VRIGGLRARPDGAMDALASYGSDDELDADAGVDVQREEIAASRGGHASVFGGDECVVSTATPETSVGGRVRAFPHKQGDFATHVRVPMAIPVCSRVALARALAAVVTIVPALRPVGRDLPVSQASVKHDPESLLPEPGHTHLSLSRVFSTRAEGHASLVASLRHALAPTKTWTATLGPGFETFTNEDKSSTFLALAVRERGASSACSKTSSFLNAVHAVDAALVSRNHPPFYGNPKPHVSIMWAPGDVAAEVASAARTVFAETAFAGTAGTEPKAAFPGTEPESRPRSEWCVDIRVKKVVCKISGFSGHTVWGRMADFPRVAGLEPRERECKKTRRASRV